ncbi:MAG TPA: 4-alpha-glucanotransferase, partial [Rhodopila sp.]|nr:4-alpha-glucanotransferase [Rhodopila sp.]
MSDEVLRDLAQRAGIAVEWQDAAGTRHVVAPEVLRRVLAALRLPADSSRDLAASRRLLMKRGSLADLPPLLTALAGRPTRLEVGGNEPQPAELVLERGGTRALSLLPARGRLRIPAISEIGYHRLRVADREVVLAVAPPRCRAIEDIVPDPRLWGIAAQLHGLRRSGDGGIGDLAGVAELARAAGAKGADAILLSPMHALYAADPGRFGPYAPSSRLFLNPLHAAPDLVFGGGAGQPAASPNGLTDWVAGAGAKYAALRNRFYSFLDSDEWNGALGADFARFRAEGGRLLLDHACFEALQAGRMPQLEWREWPVDLREPGGAAVACFADAYPDEVLFHQFLQWVSDRSVAAAQDAARQAGMRIGLIRDLVMGMDPAG